MSVASYADVARLDERTVRELLTYGSNLERVWAAWVLGTRLGSAFGPEAGSRLATEPEPGVRRHLAVVLAGTGQRAAVAALAAHDPNDLVRGTAIGLMLQIAPAEERSTVVAQVITSARTDASAYVRTECVRALAAVRPPIPPDDLEECLADTELEVRSAAVDLLLERNLDGPLIALLARAASGETDMHLRTLVWRHLSVAGHAAKLMRALDQEPTSETATLLEALSVIASTPGKLGWANLAQLAERCEAAIDAWIFELLDDPSTAPLPFLVSRAVPALDTSDPHHHDRSEPGAVGWQAIHALAKIGSLARAPVACNDELRPGLEAVVEFLTSEAAELRLRRDDGDDGDYWSEAIEDLEALRLDVLGLL